MHIYFFESSNFCKNGYFHVFLIILLNIFTYAQGEKFPERLVQEGETVHLPCKVLSNANSIQWFKDSNPILLDFSPTQRRHWNISNEGVTYVSIKSASMQDAGEWECWHHNQGSLVAKTKVMKLLVFKPPTPPVLLLKDHIISSTANLPDYILSLIKINSHENFDQLNNENALISVSYDRLSLREKKLFTIECVQLSWTLPSQSLHWFVGGHNLTNQSKLFMEYLSDQQVYKSKSSLTFNVTKEMLRGHLVCEIENFRWSNSQSIASIELDVQYEPSFSISRNPEFGFGLVQGMTVTLTCDLDANPPAQAKLIRDGNKNESLFSDNIISTSSLNNAQLIFKEINEVNSGWYKCIAEHAFGHFESYGYYLNIRTDLKLSSTSNNISLNKQNAFLNKDLKTKKQNIESNSNLYNYYHDQQRQTTNLKQTLDNNLNNSQNINSSPIHHYNLALSKNFNNCNSNGKPIVVALNRSVSALVGQQIIVAAIFCCEPRPRKVIWIHRHLSLKPSTTIATYTASELLIASNLRNCYRSSFKIENIKKEDAGELFFLVSNLKGLDDAYININVTGLSSSIRIGLKLIVTVIGVHLIRLLL